eukprot:5771-Heterococcus_DN1.PRE.1
MQDNTRTCILLKGVIASVSMTYRKHTETVVLYIYNQFTRSRAANTSTLALRTQGQPCSLSHCSCCHLCLVAAASVNDSFHGIPRSRA